MRPDGRIVPYAVLGALCVATVFGCHTNVGPPPPYFGPGSAPNVPPGQTNSVPCVGTGQVGLFTPGPQINIARENHNAVAFAPTANFTKGGVLVTGGDDGGNSIFFDSEVYDPVTNKWSLTAVLNPQKGYMNNTNVNPAFTTARFRNIAVVIFANKVLVSGGFGFDTNAAPAAMKSSFLFDPTKCEFTQVDDCPIARYYHQGVLLNSGKVLVCTGFEVQAGIARTARSADIFDGNRQWKSVQGAAGGAVMDTHWGGVLIGQGDKAMIAGGANVTPQMQLDQPPFPANRVEIYNSNTDRFEVGPALGGDRVFFAGCTIAQGDSFLAGGLNIDAQGNTVILDTIDRFDRASGKFTATGGMNLQREFCLATEVDCGKSGNFVVTGGLDPIGRVLRTAEVWQLAINGIQKPQGLINMLAPRWNHAQAQLQDGRLLVVSGAIDNPPPGFPRTVTRACDLYQD